MSLAGLANKAKNAAGKTSPKGKSKFGLKKAVPTQDNYCFDFSINFRDVEKFAHNRRLLSIEIGSKFGDAATVIDYGQHPTFDNPEIDPLDLADPDMGEINRIHFQAEIQSVVRARKDYELKCSQVYHVIWSKCTTAMQNAVKQDPDFEQYDRDKDPLPLWLKIVDISLNGIGVPENDEKKINEARHRFDRVSQRRDETVGAFYDRFNTCYDAMTAQGARLYQIFIPANIAAVPANVADAVRDALTQESEEREERAKAMAFINKLDRSRFGGMLDELDNALQNNRDEYPQTLVEAYTKASRYKKNGVYVDGMISARQENNYPAVYATMKDEKGKGRDGKELKCWICDQHGHKRGDCKALLNSLTYLAKKGKTFEQLQKEVKDGVALVTIKGFEEYIMAEKNKRPFNDYDVLLDNQATVSIFNNRTLLTNIRKAPTPITIGGIGKGKLKATMVGEFLWLGTVYFNPESIANILCFYDINKKYGVKFNDDVFTIMDKAKPRQLEFHARSKLYVCNVNELFKFNGNNADFSRNKHQIFVANKAEKDEHGDDFSFSGEVLQFSSDNRAEHMDGTTTLRSNICDAKKSDRMSNGGDNRLQDKKFQNFECADKNQPKLKITKTRDEGAKTTMIKGVHEQTSPINNLSRSDEPSWCSKSDKNRTGPLKNMVLVGTRKNKIAKASLLVDKNHIASETMDHRSPINQITEAGASLMDQNNIKYDKAQGGEKSTLKSFHSTNAGELVRAEQLKSITKDPSNSPDMFGTSGTSVEENGSSRGGHDPIPEVVQQFSVHNFTIKEASEVPQEHNNLVTSDPSSFPSSLLVQATSGSEVGIRKIHQVTSENFSNSVGSNEMQNNSKAIITQINPAVPGASNELSSSIPSDSLTAGSKLRPSRWPKPRGVMPSSKKEKINGGEDLSTKHALLIEMLCNPINPMKELDDYILLSETVESNMKKYTKREVERAEEAVRLFSKLGRPALKDFIDMVKNNRLKNCPIVVEDIRRALKIWGKDVGVLMGRTVRRRPDPLVDEILHRSETDYTVLYMDLFFVNGLAFLLSISKGYNLLVIRYMNDRRRETAEKAIQETISVYKKYNVVINGIISDGEGAMSALKTYLESKGIAVEQTSKNEHVAVIERAGRQVKERVRSFVNILRFELTKQMLIFLIYYLVSMINAFPRSTSAMEGVSPKTKLTGITLDYEVDCQLEFGDYVHANEDNSITNSMKARTFPAICMGPVGNLQGSYYFMNLNTWQVVKRRQWVKLPLPNEIINKINARAAKEKERLSINDLRFRIGEHDLPDDEAVEPEDPLPQEVELQNYGEGLPGEVDYEPHYFQEEEPADPEPHYFEEEEEVEPPPEAEDAEEVEDDPEPPAGYNLRDTEQRRRWREQYGFALWGETVLNTYNVKKALSMYGDEAEESMRKEMRQLHEKGVFSPVHYNELSNKQKVKLLRTLMFLKRKRNNVLKSRFVADGSTQLRFLSSVDPSSPTVSTEALFISSAIDGLEKRVVATVDIEGAYLHAKMKGEVYIQIEPVIASILASIEPEYEKYRLPNGSLVTKLDKALYGCIESARLFYEHISKTLKDHGFKPNDYDPCVFNKEMYGKQCTVVVYVDDLKISCTNGRGVDDVINDLKKVYGNVNVHKDAVIDYLGMDFDHSQPGVVKISMASMVDQVVEEMKISETARTPAAVDLFHVDDKSPKLEKEKKEKFHSVVAKLLYMAKRARPDILTAVSFLTTRCVEPTTQDWNKLLRILKYLRGTRDLALSLCAEDEIKINAYIDASFACHPDGKSHTGEMVTLGGGAVFSRSSKQKLVAKSSTEAELIGLSDGLPHVLWTKNFLQSQGYETGPAIVHQDNKSTITLAEKGRSTSNRTRHVSIRYFFVKDRIESKDINVIHTGTEKMVADFFSKPLQGHAFEAHRATIMNL